MSDFGRTSLHGVAQSVPDADNLPNKGNHGAQCITEDLLGTWFYDAAGEVWVPREYIVARYDFDVDGGEVGSIELDVEVPADVIVLDGIYDVIEAISTVGAARMAIGLEASGDVLVSESTGSAGTLGLHAIVPNGDPGNAIKTTAARVVTLEISGAVVTSGKLTIYLRCLRGFSA